MKITESSVRAARLPAGRSDVIYFDDRLAGFGLRLQGASRKFIIQYRDALGKDRRFIIGSTEELTATQARERAAQHLAGTRLAKPVYPHEERERARQAAEQQRDLAVQTLGAISKLYLDYHQRTYRAGSHKIARYNITTSWAPLHKVPIQQIDRRMIAQRLAEIVTENGPVASNKARSVLSAFMNWAGGNGFIEGNPVKFVLKQHKEKPRTRALSDAELRAIWNATDDSSTYSRIVRILLLTGQRRSEVSGMLWKELDLDKGIFTLPAARSKIGKDHVLPLVPEVLDLITIAPRMGDAVFATGAKQQWDAYSHHKKRLDARVAELLGAPMEPWVLHDLRRCQRTRMVETLRIPVNVAEAILNHTPPGIHKVYDVGVYVDQKREALEAWAAYLDTIVTGRDRKVVPMPRKERKANNNAAGRGR
jgi:integrase